MHIYEMSDIEGLDEQYVLSNLVTVVPNTVASECLVSLSISRTKLDDNYKGSGYCILARYNEKLLLVLNPLLLQFDENRVALRLVDIINENNIDVDADVISVRSLFDYGAKSKMSKIKTILEITKGKKNRLHILLNDKFINESKLGAILSDLLMCYTINSNEEEVMSYESFFVELQTLFPLSRNNFKDTYERFINQKNSSLNKYLIEKLSNG